jgi:hypothetical protein
MPCHASAQPKPQTPPATLIAVTSARLSTGFSPYYTHLINSSSGLFNPSSEYLLLNGEIPPWAPRNWSIAYQLPTATKVPSPTKTHTKCDPALPTETIRNASNECQDEAPRWWNNGVSTSPFSAWRLGFAAVPERIRRSDLFFCWAWIVLFHLVS